MKRLLCIFLPVAMLLMALPAVAQHPQLGKLSPWLRHIVRNQPSANAPMKAAGHTTGRQQQVIAFVRLATADDEQVLAANGCRSLAHYGDLHIASIPLSRLTSLTSDRRVLRIEANRTNHLTTDSLAIHLNATQAYTGTGLPQAFTGRGVVMGIMDIGIDLSHPTFYSRDTTDYRIRRLWDQLSQDTVGSPFPVGRDYTTREELLAVAHTRDNIDLEHGTHTLGIAAGSGYDSEFQGMAPEADICLVANAVSDDLPYIDSTDVYKYTFATDALGFKYIFDYAESCGQPCVISFSEGSPQDFYGYDELYYAMLDSLTGPGRIIVASTGNNGKQKNYLHKPQDQYSAGTFLRGDSTMTVVLRSDGHYALRLVAYGSPNDTLTISTEQVCQQPDSVLLVAAPAYRALLEAYPSSYEPSDICIDLTVIQPGGVGSNPRLSLELVGSDADVELWRMNGLLTNYAQNPLLDDAQNDHFVFSPASAPCVIGVGATCYRDHLVNIIGKTYAYSEGTDGRHADFSSMGPTFDGRLKPDCVAPGNYVLSSYGSYRLEHHPESITLHTRHFDFNGRTYAWGGDSGTSMSAPAVGGSIALWLQACPTLTPDDVRALLARTCHHYDPSLTYPNNMYGYGEIDVYAGLLDLLGLSSIGDVPRRHTTADLRVSGAQLLIRLPQTTASTLSLRICDLGGRNVLTAMLPQGTDSYSVDLPALASGVYAVCIGDASTLIRIGR